MCGAGPGVQYFPMCGEAALLCQTYTYVLFAPLQLWHKGAILTTSPTWMY